MAAGASRVNDSAPHVSISAVSLGTCAHALLRQPRPTAPNRENALSNPPLKTTQGALITASGGHPAGQDDREAEAAWADWRPVDVLPHEPTWAMVKLGPSESAPQSRVLFNGHFWMSRDPFLHWRPLPEGELPVSQLMSELVSSSADALVIDGLEVLDVDRTDYFDDQLSLLELAKMELGVEVIRMFKPGPQAKGALSGQVLAVSRNYAAQSIGDDAVVIHEQSRLDRRVSPGERVTLNYEGGRAKVYNGVFFDVNVRAPFLAPEQVVWVRMKMIEALSSVENADQDDGMIREALRYALTKTAELYGLDKLRLAAANISLSVRDTVTPHQIQLAAATEAAGAIDLVPIRDGFSRPRT